MSYIVTLLLHINWLKTVKKRLMRNLKYNMVKLYTSMNIKIFKNLLTPFLISILLSLSFTAPAAPEITLGVTEKCPYICDKNAVNQGMLIDIIKSIFEKNNIKVKIRYSPMNRTMLLVKDKKVDGVIGILQRNAPGLVFPDKSIGQTRYMLYTAKEDDWLYTGLNSLNSRKIAVESGKSYGIFDSYIQRYATDNTKIYQVHGTDITKRLVQMLQRKRFNLLLEDKNIFDFNKKELKTEGLNEAGSIPPDTLYVGFLPSNNKAQKFADIVTKGMTNMRKSGELEKILANYGMSDWVNWKPSHRDPFAGNYTERLEKNFFYEKKKIDTTTMIFEGSTAKGGGYWKYAEKFKESLERLSNGKLKVQLKFGVTTEHNIVMNIAEGKSHMGMIATNNLTPFAPSLGFLALPYMFPSEAGIKKLLHDPLMEKIANRAGLESNVRPLSFFVGGYRLLANNKRIVKKSSELQGLRIRVPRNQLMLGAFRSWGLEATPLPWTEIYPALESGLIDGQENPITIIFDGVNMKKPVWEVLKYITNIHYFMFTAPHMMSESFYRQLSDENQFLVRKAAREAEAYSWELVKKEDKKITQFAKNKGIVFVDPINEKEDWQAKARSIWPNFYFRVGGKELVDSVLAIVKD